MRKLDDIKFISFPERPGNRSKILINAMFLIKSILKKEPMERFGLDEILNCKFLQ